MPVAELQHRKRKRVLEPQRAGNKESAAKGNRKQLGRWVEQTPPVAAAGPACAGGKQDGPLVGGDQPLPME